MSNKNMKITLAKRPIGMPDKSCFEFSETQAGQPAKGEVLVKTLYLSVDPYMRGRMNDAKSYMPPFNLNETITGSGVGEIIESNAEGFSEGDYVTGKFKWEKFPVLPVSDLRKVDSGAAPLTAYLNILGPTGLTAYFGIMDIGKPKPGETFVVSGAAGAVGSVAGQIAKLLGCRVVGIAGSDEKVQMLKEKFGFDEAINYKTEKDIKAALQKACPNGIDIYFDNVGGEISDAAISLINFGARIPLCGQIAYYNTTEELQGPRVTSTILLRMALMQGFLILNYAERFPEGLAKLAEWYKAGKLQMVESVTEGFENLPDAFLGLFTGKNTGKQVVKV